MIVIMWKWKRGEIIRLQRTSFNDNAIFLHYGGRTILSITTYSSYSGRKKFSRCLPLGFDYDRYIAVRLKLENALNTSRDPMFVSALC
jgi:hypothetical protein